MGPLLHGLRVFLALTALSAALILPSTATDRRADIDALLAKAADLSSERVRRADLAIPLLKEALSLAEATGDSDRGALAAARLGAALRSTHEADAAHQVLVHGITLAREAHRPDLEGLCQRTIGNLHVEGGRYDLATDAFEQALAIAERNGLVDQQIAALNSLSASARRQGRLTEALERSRRALQLLDAQIAQGRTIETSPLFAVPFNVGKALADGGDYAAALGYFERAFDAAERRGNIAGIWHALFDTAEWYQSQGDLERAATYYRRALDQSRKAESQDMEANTIRGLGSIAEERGELPEAIERYATALSLFEQYKFEGSIPATLTALARAYAKAGRAADAQRTLDVALRRVRAGGRPLDVTRVLIESGSQARGRRDFDVAARAYGEARRSAAENGLRPVEAIAISGLARTAHDRGDAGAALDLYRQAETAIQRLRARIPAPDQQATFSDAVHATFAGELELLMALHEAHPSSGYDRRAFLTLERERAQDLADALVDGRVDRARELPPDVRERQGRVARRLAEVQTELMAADIPDDRRRALRAEQDDQEREWETVAGAARRPSSSDGPPNRADADTLAALQSALAPGEAFVAYAPSHAFVVSRDTFRAVPLGAVDGLETRVDFFVRLLSGDDPESAPISGGVLAAALVEPVDAAFPGDPSRIVISATGALAGLPFGALPDPRAGGTAPLLARYEIGYAPSATSLILSRIAAHGQPALGLLAVANAPSPVSRAQLLTASLTRTGGLSALPYSEQEAQRAMSRSSLTSRLLLGADANEYLVKHEQLADYTVLHFATHAVLDPIAPRRSAVVLGAGHGEDGLLQAREIFQLTLNADLVVLSACRTAAGRPSSAEGMQSLARAFLYSGSRSVVATLWDVDDRATARLIDRFYEQMSAGSASGAALRAAQIDAMGKNPYKSAPQWAGFLVSGDPSVHVRGLEPVTPRVSVVVTALVAAVLLSLFVVFRRRRESLIPHR